MERIPPSEKLRKELREMINSAHGPQLSVSDIVRKAAGLVVQEMMEQEVTDFLGREHYERAGGEEVKKGYRNGYEPFTIRTGEGAISVSRPQVRDTDYPYQSRLAAFFKGNTEVLEKLAVEMYARGLSTRDVEDALRDECLNVNWFLSIQDARQKIEAWRRDYNEFRPHSSIGDMTPNEFAEQSRQKVA